MDTPTLEWSALEYREKERSIDWFWALGIIAVSTAVVSIIYENYLFAIFIILAAIILGFFATRQPEVIDLKITQKGLVLGHDTYAYDKLKSFHMLERENGESVILVMSTRSIVPVITIPLGDTDPELARETLSHYLPEERHEEPTARKIMDYLGI